MRGKYAGQPISFACSVCRKSPGFYDSATKRTSGWIGRRFTTTGKTRSQKSQGANHHGWSSVAYQYRCVGCGHAGWSRHPDVEARWTAEHGRGQGGGS